LDASQGLPIGEFASQRAWEEWLEAEHATAKGVWLRLAKKGAGVESVSHAEAIESALCYGWIDSQARSLDERFWLLRFTPRGRRSKWSRINRDNIAELERRGRVRPAGLAEVERARQDGRWDAAYEPPSTATVPEDLQRALDAEPALRTAFAALDGRNRYSILHRLHDAKKPETRARRLEQFVAMLREGRRIHP
jgi:uncharacterized protein YdeI (YjbR/CyaY-like superfamily)